MIRENQTIAYRITLRSEKKSDEAFLAELYASTRSEELATLGWTSEQTTAFCQFQFRLQNEAYKMQFPDAVNSIIELEERACGRILVNHGDKNIRLIDISLLPESRNQGAGTIIIEDLQRTAKTAGKPLNLSVMKTNIAAIRLYQRLDFSIIESNQTHFSMQWRGR